MIRREFAGISREKNCPRPRSEDVYRGGRPPPPELNDARGGEEKKTRDETSIEISTEVFEFLGRVLV